MHHFDGLASSHGHKSPQLLGAHVGTPLAVAAPMSAIETFKNSGKRPPVKPIKPTSAYPAHLDDEDDADLTDDDLDEDRPAS